MGLSLLAAVSNWAAEPRPAQPTAPSFGEMEFEQLAKIKITSVSKKEETLTHAAAAVQVITQDDIRRSGAISLAEALRLAPGLQVARIDARRWAISSRGFNGEFANKLLVLVDGRSVYTPLFSGVQWHLVDTVLEDVDRIEVIRGPGATVWGANAVNGVINIVTKSARETQGGLLTIGGGTEDLAFTSLRYGLKLNDDTFVRLYGKVGLGDESQFTSGVAAGDAWRQGMGGFRMDWEPSDSHQFMLQGEGYSGRNDEQLASGVLDPTRSHGGHLLGRWSHELAADSKMRLQAFYDRQVRDSQGFKEDRSTLDVEFQHQFVASERHALVWGAGYRLSLDTLDPGRVVFAPVNRQLNLFNLFLQDEITLVTDRLSFIPGIKLEQHEFTGLEIQPGARLAWTPHEHHTLWASVSRAVRTPSRADNDLSAVVPGALTVVSLPNTALSSERLTAYEIGYRVQPHARLNVDTALFYNDYTRLRSTEAKFTPVPPTLTTIRGQRLVGETYGGEVSLVYQATDHWRLTANYSYLNMQLHRLAGSTDTTSAGFEHQSPRQQFALLSRLNLPRNVELDANFRYVGGLSTLAIRPYYTLDMRLGWRPSKNWELSLVGQNLLEPAHPEFFTQFAAPLPKEVERSMYGKVTWRF